MTDHAILNSVAIGDIKIPEGLLPGGDGTIGEPPPGYELQRVMGVLPVFVRVALDEQLGKA